MKLHLIGFPHTRVSPDFCGCAYTAKILKFVKMMRSRYDLVLYAPEGSEVEGAELVPVLTEAERVATFGPDDPGRLPDWPSEEQWRLFNARTIVGLAEHAEPRDFVLLFAGRSQQAVADATPHLLSVEPGVGYEGIFTNRCAFESNAWRHFLYAKAGIEDGRWFDTVIPNYFDQDDFPILNPGGGDYLLFLGRLVARKGPSVAAEVAAASGLPLVVAGAGATSWGPGFVEAPEVRVECPGLEYVGPVGVAERAELLAGARALLVPTSYIEPFGGVAVEAMMAGTPAITTAWGAFSETVEPYHTGFHFNSLQEGVDAVAVAGDMDNYNVRARARGRFALEAVAPQFRAWLDRAGSLWGDGWYERSPTPPVSSDEREVALCS